MGVLKKDIRQSYKTTFAAPLLSALLLIPAFPPLDQGYLAWFALLPFLWFCFKASPRQALAGGFLFGIPLHIYLNLYLSEVLFSFLTPALASLAMALLILIISTLNALFAALASYAFRSIKNSLALSLIIPSAWLLFEYVRSLTFFAYNVGYIGYTQWGYPVVLNIVSVYGYWGLPFLMVFLQTILLMFLLRIIKGKFLVAAALIFFLLSGVGIVAPQFFPVEKKDAPIWSAFIQGNSSIEEILSSSGREEILQRYLMLTRQAKEKEPRLEMVVWPETVVELILSEGSGKHKPEMLNLARELDISILYGAKVKKEDALYNAVVYLTPEGDYQGYYKQRLVPFVEFFPMESLLNEILQLDILLGRYNPGEEINLFHTPKATLGGVVCFESYFGDYTRHFSRLGSDHLFILTNDAWFGKTIGLEQHAQVGAIRAAEIGTGVTQVANSGITISFDHRGKELFRSGKMVRDIFILPLNLTHRNTVYVMAGDFFPAFWIFFLIFYAVFHQLKVFKKAKTL